MGTRRAMLTGHSLRVALFVVLALLLGACKGLRVEQLMPQVRVGEVRLVDADAQGGRVRVLLSLHNPNPVPLRAERYDYRLRLAGVPVASGTSATRIDLPANGEQTLAMDIDFRWQRLAEGLQAMLRGRRLEYGLDGHLEIQPFRVPFSASGRLDLTH